MTIESTIGIISGLLAIVGAVIWLNDRLKKLSMASLMEKLVDKNTPVSVTGES